MTGRSSSEMPRVEGGQVLPQAGKTRDQRTRWESGCPRSLPHFSFPLLCPPLYPDRKLISTLVKHTDTESSINSWT